MIFDVYALRMQYIRWLEFPCSCLSWETDQ